MVRKIKWTLAAWTDLEGVADFIAKDSPYYASSFVKQVQQAAQSLKQFSERGRLVPEIETPDIREIFVGNYRLIYQVAKEQVNLLAFIHGARDLSNLWKNK